jgi:aspartate kinase
MKVIKFGGTAFQTPKLVENVSNIISKQEKPLIVIVSAIGRKGFPFATDTLLESIKECKLSNKEKDRLLGLGETYAGLFLSNFLNNKSINAYSLSYLENGIVCNNNYSEGIVTCLNDEYYQKYLKKHEVLIVPGFIGSSIDNEIITLGRGTSDLTAVLLSKLFRLKEVTLYKEVDGIYPTLFINLLKIKPYEFMSYEEVNALIDIGISPVNEKALIEAKEENITIVVKNYIENKYSTIISKKSSNNKVIGFNVINNKFSIATFFINEIKEELFEILKQQHIYVKDEEIKENYFSFKLNGSQILLVRQIIIKKYFYSMLKL